MRTNYCQGLILVLGCIVKLSFGDQTGQLEYKYAVERELIKEKEKEFANNKLVLTEDEKIVDNYLEYLKREEFKATKHNFLPSRPIESVLSQIRQSKIFHVLKKFPKGGNMHLHQNHILAKAKMLDMIFSSPIVNDLCVNLNDGDKKWGLKFSKTPPVGWVKVTSDTNLYSKANLLKHITLLNTLDDQAKSRPTDSETRWIELIPIFDKAGTDLVLYENYTRMHLRALFESALAENIQYIEARTSGHGLYALDDSQPNGHRYLDTPDNEGDSWFQVVREELAAFQKTHQQFIGYRDIIQVKRFAGTGTVQNGIARARRLMSQFPDLVQGVDLVAEEDQGYSLLYYIDEFMEASKLNNSMPYFFHTAETNWPDDLLFSPKDDDPVGTLDNVYEAVILGAKRVGHGIGFINHPAILEMMRDKAIAVEANPVSNMMLGYVPDQRHHPAINYIRSGIPVVLGADDPGTMGYNDFTVDWYEAFMAWGLRLKDMKLLAINSLTYSTMAVDEKANALQKWSSAWNLYITSMKNEACHANFILEKAEVHSIFPKQSPVGSSLKVRVFGRYFQTGICRNIICRFGDLTTIGEYVYNTMIQCAAPTQQGRQGVVDFSISLDSGLHFIDTQHKFTFSNANGKGSSPVVIGK